MMKVEAVSSSSPFSDDDEKNLQTLLEAFGSAVSLDAIASSYCETGRNLESTAQMLCNMQGSISATEDYPKKADKASSGSSSSSSLLEESHIVKANSRKCSASIGTVSSVIGKDYINPRPQPKGLNEKLKSAMLNSNDFPVTAIWGEEKDSEFTSQGQPMENDLGEFLCKMLGNGFQLDMGVIQQVIGQCGYNMPVIIDKLFDISAATIEKNDDVIGVAAVKNMENIHDVGSTSCPEQSRLHSPRRDASGGDESILRGTDIKMKDTQREVLVSLFSVPDRIQDHQASTRQVTSRRQSAYGRIVAKPLEENLIEDFTFITRQPINDKNNEANEESYDEMEKARKENWVTMKEYYKASGDAFIKKDFETAQSLLEQGDFYKEKAREAREKSAQKLIAMSNKDEDFFLNVHYFDPKDARDHMKVQLNNLCGLPSVRFMKVVVGTTGNKKDLRRKHLITKLLEKEGVSWTEEGNGWIISIQIDEIDPRNLSFFK